VSITVIERDGRLLPFEQFRAEVHDSCAVGGLPVPHLHPRSGGAAIAIDRTSVADPAPDGCGFGPPQGGAPGAAVVRLASVEPAAAQAWSGMTGIPLTTSAAAPPPGTETPAAITTPAVNVERNAPTISNTPIWSMLIVPLLLLAGVAGGCILTNRGAKPATHPAAERRPQLEDYEPLDGDGALRERLARGHAGLLRLRTDVPLLASDIEAPQDSPEINDTSAEPDAARAPEDRDERD
jgi:hypothetical protein